MSAIERLARALCKGYAERLIDGPLDWSPGPDHLHIFVERHWREWMWAAQLAIEELRAPLPGDVRYCNPARDAGKDPRDVTDFEVWSGGRWVHASEASSIKMGAE